MTELDLLSDLIRRAKAAGADAADAVLVAGTSIAVQRRLGRIEKLERAEGRDLGLRVFVGRRSASVSSSAVDPAGFGALAERAVAMARVVPEDPYGGLAEAASAPEPVDLDLEDPSGEPEAESLVARAAAAEEAALAVPGVTNSEGAEAGYSRTEVFLVTSAGFAGHNARTTHTVSATALAGEGTAMQRDYDFSSTTHLDDLEDPATLGRVAGDKAVARLNPTRPKTARLPVVYDPRVASSLLGHFAGAINGAAIARGTSFLKERMGETVFAPGITIHDDPRRRRGLRSRPFDAEGVPTTARRLIDDGVLTTWLLDSRSARQLGLQTTGSAARGIGSPPGPAPTNLYLAAGTISPAELMADIGEGLYVTELIGMGVNGTHRRLQPGRRRVHDPRRRVGRAGGRDHGRRVAAGDVPAPHAGERPALPPRRRLANGAGRRHDAGGRVARLCNESWRGPIYAASQEFPPFHAPHPSYSRWPARRGPRARALAGRRAGRRRRLLRQPRHADLFRAAGDQHRALHRRTVRAEPDPAPGAALRHPRLRAVWPARLRPRRLHLRPARRPARRRASAGCCSGTACSAAAGSASSACCCSWR